MTKIKFKLGEKTVELEKDQVSSALETGEITLPIDNLTVLDKADGAVIYTKEERETFENNFGKTKYEEGKTAQEEMLVKAAKERNGLSFEGKSFDKFEEALKAKIIADAKIEPDEKVKELEGSLQILQTNYKTLENEYTTFKTGISEKETQAKKDNTILSFMPDDVIVPKDIALMAIKNKAGIDVEFTEIGTPLQVINGVVQKDKTQEPVVFSKEFLTGKLKELNLLKTKEGGPGGADELGGGAGDYVAFTKEMEANGVAAGSEKFNLELNKRIKDKTISI
jgi:hypothetical protein